MSFSFPGDLDSVAFTGLSIVPGTTISSATTTDGTAVDCADADDHLTLWYATGDAGDGSTTIVVSLIESDTSGGSYTAVTNSSDSRTASATANDNLYRLVSTRYRSKRWVKVRVVTAGGTPSVPIAAGVLGRKRITGSGTGYKT